MTKAIKTKPQEAQHTNKQGLNGIAFPHVAGATVQLQNEAPKDVVNNDKPTLQPKTQNKTGLPDKLKLGIERLSGYSMDDVRVHRNSSKPAQLQAYAYAQGTDIHLAAGQERHLPHEAWHVVQQKQGRVKPTLQMKTGHLVNDNQGLEREADVMGERVMKNSEYNLSYSTNHLLWKSNTNKDSPIQRFVQTKDGDMRPKSKQDTDEYFRNPNSEAAKIYEFLVDSSSNFTFEDDQDMIQVCSSIAVLDDEERELFKQLIPSLDRFIKGEQLVELIKLVEDNYGIDQKIDLDLEIMDWPDEYDRNTAEDLGIYVCGKLNITELRKYPHITEVAIEALKRGDSGLETMKLVDDRWERVYDGAKFEVWVHNSGKIMSVKSKGMSRKLSQGLNSFNRDQKAMDIPENHILHCATHVNEFGMGHKHSALKITDGTFDQDKLQRLIAYFER